MGLLAHRKYPQWAPPGTALAGPLPEAAPDRVRAVELRLLELARVSLAILDIDAVRDCIRPESRIEISSDDFAYDTPLANAVKRGLLRIERLCDLEPESAVWRLCPDKPGRADLVLVGRSYASQFSGWGGFPIAIPEAMQSAFEGEPASALSGDERLLSVFAPLRDSLDDVVAVLELCVGLRAPSVDGAARNSDLPEVGLGGVVSDREAG